MIWGMQFYIGFLILTAFFCFKVFQRAHWSVAILLTVILFSAQRVFDNVDMQFDDVRLKIGCARSFAWVLALSMFFYLQKKDAWKWLDALAWVAVIDSTWVIITGFYAPGGYGIFNAGSCDCAFIAAMSPLIVCRGMPPNWQPWYQRRYDAQQTLKILIMTTALLRTNGGTAALVLIAAYSAYVIAKGMWKYLIVPVLIGVGFGMWSNSLAHLSSLWDRTGAWKIYLEHFWYGTLMSDGKNEFLLSAPNHWLGAGTGSFIFFGPLLRPIDQNLYIWAHNDWVQILFEQGILGLLAALTVTVICLRRAFNRPFLFATVVGFCTAMVTQFPLRMVVGEIAAIVLIMVCMDIREAT